MFLDGFFLEDDIELISWIQLKIRPHPDSTFQNNLD